MKKESFENPYMSSTYNKLCRVLRFMEKSLDDEVFKAEDFTPERFGVNEVVFRKLIRMLLEEKFIKGVVINDRGAPDAFTEMDGDKYERYYLSFDDPEITIKGLRFLAENSVLARAWGAVKGIGDLAALVPGV